MSGEQSGMDTATETDKSLRPAAAILRKIRLQTGRKISTMFVGEYHSAFKGTGLNFEGVREYQYGDDVRSIDWNVSARLDHLFIKEFTEERELSVVFMVDVSGSSGFGSARRKLDVIHEAAALFLYLSQMNNDRVSVLLFSDRVEKYLRPRKGGKFVLKVIDEMLRCRPEGKGTDIGAACEFVSRVQKKRSVVFLISDFLENGDNYRLRLKHLSKKHDIIPIQVSDPLERRGTHFGLTEFLDLETGEVFLSDSLPDDLAFPELQDFNSIKLTTAEPIEPAVMAFFERRNRTKLIKNR